MDTGVALQVGDPVRAWGRLTRTPDGTWFEPPLPRQLPAYVGGAPAPVPSDLAVALVGADFNLVENRYERDGSVEGFATVTGTWLGDHLEVLAQSLHRPVPPPTPTWTVPPGVEPLGGWPRSHSQDNLDYDLGDLHTSGAAVTFVIFRPADDQAVLAVAATDLDAVEAQLRPALGDRLCVVPSRWTRSEIDQVLDELSDHWDEWGIYGCGQSCGDDAQAVITAELIRVTPDVVDWASSVPAGLLTLRPWLRPA